MNTTTRYEKGMKAIATLRAEINNLEEIRKIMEGTRVRLEGALQDLNHVTTEFRGQGTVVKERSAYLISALDALEKSIMKATNPGDDK